MATEHRDYSGTPLPTKLGIRPGARLSLVDPPDGFLEALGPLPTGVTVLSRRTSHLDVVVVFATSQARLARRVPSLAAALTPGGRLWLAWPKKASKIATDITFDSVQGLGLGAGLVDNKSASLTDVFQGLQFVYRLRDRPRRG
jgi:hypothetical protein